MAREAEQFFWRKKVRPKETVNDLGQPVVSPRGRDVTFSSVVMVWSYFVAVAICVLLSWCRGNRYHKLGGFKPQKCIVSPSARPEVPNQSIGRLAPSEGGEHGSFPGLSPWLQTTIFPLSVPLHPNFHFPTFWGILHMSQVRGPWWNS